VEEITAGKYYKFRGKGVLALNPIQPCSLGFDVVLCRYVGEADRFYVPASELRSILPKVLIPSPSDTGLAYKIQNHRKYGRTYKQIAIALNNEGIRTHYGAEWTDTKVRDFATKRKDRRWSCDLSGMMS
jgi:hypothetical protein